MESWAEGFKAALLTYVRTKGRIDDAEEITSWDEEISSGDLGGCDTCGYGSADPYVLTIRFRRTNGTFGSYMSTMPFGELVSTLGDM